MPKASSKRRTKRKMEDNIAALEPSSKSSTVTLQGSSLVLQIPPDTNTSLPVWEAIRSQQLETTWTVNPYGISVHLSPVTSKQGKSPSSSKRITRSKATKSPTPSSSLLKRQTFAQLFSASCLQLTFPQNNPPPSQTTAANPFLFSRSLNCIPMNAIVPAICTPTTTSAKLKAPLRSQYFTKVSSDIQICDSFLLSVCQAGKRCQMHHTPFPFHWQMWCLTSQQWIDFQPRSQVSLERLYSNVNQNVIDIHDAHGCYTLNFDLMEVNPPSKYKGIRRLTNTDSPVKNPYFPSKWKIYWLKDCGWEEYSENLSACLLKKMSEKEEECCFCINSKEYKVDFAAMLQTNLTTQFRRKVRCRPVYRSPDSMQAYLQTGILTYPAKALVAPPAANFSVDPLKEFSSWYPPVWSLPLEDYSVVDVPAGSQAYNMVQGFFHESLPENEVDIVNIQQVQNLLHWDKYQRQKVHMQKQLNKSKEPLERHLFHGTTRRSVEHICHSNFDPRMAGINGSNFGFGSYFATKASLSNNFSLKDGLGQLRYMFLAKVLVGKVCFGVKTFRRPPPVNYKSCHRLYDSCVDKVDNPTIFVVFDNCQCYPYYLITYIDLPKIVGI